MGPIVHRAARTTLAAVVLAGVGASATPPPPPAPAPTPSAAPVRTERTCSVRVVRLERARATADGVPPGREAIAGALVWTRVDLEIDGAPLAQVLNAIGRAARVNLVGIYRTTEGGAGLDRSAPVSLLLRDVSAMEAIEHAISAATGMVDSTWQVRGNVVECGPKAMLAEVGRRETRVHDISDVRFEVPSSRAGANPNHGRRKPKQITADFARLVMNNVEPDAWRPAEDEAPAPGTPGAGAPRPGPGTPGGGTPPPLPSAPSNLDGDDTDEIYVRGRWASMHFKNDTLLVVHAPDFIHRQLAGYGEMMPPAPIEGVPVGVTVPVGDGRRP